MAGEPTMIIRTKYRGPTDHVGARIIATAPGFSAAPRIVRPYCHARSGTENHAAAAMELADQLGIVGKWAAGEDGSGCVFVRVFPSDHRYQSEGAAGERRRQQEKRDMAIFAVVDTSNDNEVVATASTEEGAKSIINTADLPPMRITDKSTLQIVKTRKKQHIGNSLTELDTARALAKRGAR